MQIVLLGFTGLVAASSAVACFWFVVVDAGQGARLLAESGVTSFLPLVVVAGAATIAVLVFRLRRAHLALISTLATVWVVTGLWIFPQMDPKRSASEFIARLEALAAPDRELGLLQYHEHFLLHLTRPTVNFGHRRFREGDAEEMDAAAWLAADSSRQLLVQEETIAPCFTHVLQKQLVGDSSRGNWFLVSGPPDAACAARGNAQYKFPLHTAGEKLTCG